MSGCEMSAKNQTGSYRDKQYTISITLNKVQFLESSGYSEPIQGHIFVIVDVIDKNFRPDPIRSIGGGDFQVRELSSALRDYRYFNDTDDCKLLRQVEVRGKEL